MEGSRKRLTPQQALEKIKHYCSYQERSHREVKDKLYSFGLYPGDVDKLVVQLLEENYLSEERFATGYARGHFKLKKWGRIKIMHGLRQHFISPYNLKLALKEIDENEYQNVLEKLAADKWESLKREQPLTRQAKTTAFLQQRGFELPLISKALARLQPPKR